MLGFGQKKIDKDAWTQAIYGKKLRHPEKESEDQLSAVTTGMLMQYSRIITDSVRIIRSTKNADTRLSRIDLCHRNYQAMLKLKPFCNKEQLAMIKKTEEELKRAGIENG